MPNWKVGKVVKLNSPKGEFEVKEVIDKPAMNLDWDWDKGNCPHCGVAIKNPKSYKLEKIFILEALKMESGKLRRPMLGETEPVTPDGLPLLMRLPDDEFHVADDMTADVKKKSTYLKGVLDVN